MSRPALSKRGKHQHVLLNWAEVLPVVPFSELKCLSNLLLRHLPVFSFMNSQHLKYGRHASLKREVPVMYVLLHYKQGRSSKQGGGLQ